MIWTSHHHALALIAGLLPDQRLALLHLDRCPRCRAQAAREMGEAARGELAALDRPRPPRRAITGEELERLFERSQAATWNARDLAGMTPAAALQAIAADPRLRDPLVATSLLFAADSALEDPTRAAPLGEAAFAILSSHDPDAAGRNLAKLCRALWTVLRAARLQGRLEEAEDAFRRGLPYLGAAPPVSEERATLLAGVAQLRWHERRLDEAAALFAQAARMFGELAERQGEAACRAQAGALLVEQLDPGRATAELAVAHLHLDASLAPALAVRVALMLAWCHLAAGRSGLGRERLRAARGLYAAAPEAGEELLQSWWEARIAALDDTRRAGPEGSRRHPSPADDLFDSVRRRLLAEGSVAEAARCTLDLLELRVEVDRLEALSDLGPDLLRGFDNHPSAFQPAQMIDALAVLAVQRSARYPAALATTRYYLAGSPRHAGTRPDLIPDVRLLADRLLVAARPERRSAARALAQAREAGG
ncbi:MAG TPA: hypothetical protein VMW75_22210 [Thermoanaerobaculia bacterium]|nr:hypothetical protein [Thermoanaerobaculia bacterium]